MDFRPLTVSIAYYYGKQIIFRDKRLLLPCIRAAKRQRAATISPSWIGSWWQTKWIDKATSRRFSLLLGRTTFGQNHHIYLIFWKIEFHFYYQKLVQIFACFCLSYKTCYNVTKQKYRIRLVTNFANSLCTWNPSNIPQITSFKKVNVMQKYKFRTPYVMRF